MKKSIVVSLLLLSISAFSQEGQKSSLNVEGQIAVTTNAKDVFMNFGGPALKFGFSKVAFALNFMPSLRFHNVNNKVQLTPVLGTGLQVYGLKDKRFVLSFPFYYLTSSNAWVGTAGIGYVLTKPKK